MLLLVRSGVLLMWDRLGVGEVDRVTPEQVCCSGTVAVFLLCFYSGRMGDPHPYPHPQALSSVQHLEEKRARMSLSQRHMVPYL